MADDNLQRLQDLATAYKAGRLPPGMKEDYETAVRAGKIADPNVPNVPPSRAPGDLGSELDWTDVAATSIDPGAFAAAIPRGLIRGAVATPALLGEMGRAEIESLAAPFGGAKDLPPSATVEQLAEPIARAGNVLTEKIPVIGGDLFTKPEGPSGEAGERVAEFVGDIGSWIGPGGKILKLGQAIAGGLGSFIGEKAFGAKGAVGGAMLGGGLTGLVTPRGLTPRPPRAVRTATTEQAVYADSKAGYRAMAMLNYQMDIAQAGAIRRAIVDDLTVRNPAEPDRMLILQDQAPSVFNHLDLLIQPSSVPNRITVNEVERVRQVLQTDRISNRISNPGAAEAAGRAIAVIDEFLFTLPGVEGIARQARENWAAYKRGQMVEETLRRAVDRANTTGTGFNIDNAIRQEFRRRIRDKPEVWRRFSAREQQEINLIMDPGRTANFLGRYVSRFGPQHILTGTLGTSAGVGAMTHNPLDVLMVLATGAAGHQLSKHLAHGRAERLAEITRARSPAGGGYEPGPLLTRPQMGGVGAARALGATALSPEASEAIELPEIKVTPQ